jgi:ABC-type microcin C transport system permease subunit YejB
MNINYFNISSFKALIKGVIATAIVLVVLLLIYIIYLPYGIMKAFVNLEAIEDCCEFLGRCIQHLNIRKNKTL